ncbi:aldo/keto reductase [Beijerinckia indica]|uniref:Aldo/keto reductase n=1 Tax=Beijerinckia indica subsp. indica (strain ATCC 9039 / DSM 1715 / NCIMB 8712) TaxID=395963 RepID=B2IJW6_BEII9|nr:aldo/keto reductase [Beijerinckia indica]ACB96341.1 aldo/keto reductase [Beijerinckia indica subsp. indica ATCC 9039]
MQYSQIPRSGEKISRLGFGAMGFAGWFGSQDEKEHVAALHLALEQGITFIDTARAYGESERIVGKALREWRGEKPFVATKVAGLAGEPQWGTVMPVTESFPPGQVRASCEQSLRALDLDQIDLLQLHTYWPNWGVSGYWMDELHVLKDEGKIRYIGISIPDHRSDMVLPIVMSGAIDAVQTIVNIFDPTALEVLVPFCREHKVAVIARCILDEGGLSGFLTSETHFAQGDFRDGYFDATVPRETYIRKVEALRTFVPANASSLAALAIKYALHDPGITTAISSMHVRAFLEANLAALAEDPLDETTFRTLMTRHRFIKNYANFKHFGVA